MIRILFSGDVVGDCGVRFFKSEIRRLKAEYSPDVVIVNGENSSQAGGICKSSAEALFSSGADVVTTGNHAFRAPDIRGVFSENQYLLRPLNYSKKAPGGGAVVLDTLKCRIAVMNISGRVFMDPANDPFAAFDEEIKKYADCAVKFVDFHAEATSEKAAFARYADGRVSAVVGTHTHVQTNDETILPGGTAFISDAGMTGAVDSILGVQTDAVIFRFTSGLPTRFLQASGKSRFNGVLIDIDEKTGKAMRILKINTAEE